ncbi:MAG: hypothetical protein WBM44_15305 [Waterburya sp.]
MNHNVTTKYLAPTVLVVNNNQENLVSNSLILDSLNQVHISILEDSNILSWVQQYQPDLIILDIGWSQIINPQLIAALRLDWLTRNIPIMVIVGSTTQQIEALEHLDYDACLIKPYSAADLGKKICSLVSTSACKMYSKKV